jgi:membrane fusion protein (multidrug efflux system)
MIVLRMMMPVLALSLFGCQRDGAQPPPTPPIAEYATVQYQSVTLTNLLPGRTSAYETSDVRPQINGLVEQRLFTEGDLVRKGQPLYRIDASPYEAHVANAQAALAKAKDSIASSAALARRYGELVKINAISKQDYENAQASAAQAEADVAAQTAAFCADRSRSHDDPRTHHRSHRSFDIHRRSAGDRLTVRATGDNSADRSDLRRHPAVKHRTTEAAPAAS